MPISPRALFQSIGLTIHRSVKWKERIGCDESGVYALSLSADADAIDCLLPEAPICPNRVGEWIRRVPQFCLDGKPQPSVGDVAACLKAHWLPDECILYIGKATSLEQRLGQLFRHRLGNRSPHAGGHWLKSLDSQDRLTVHYSICKSPKENEDKALAAFVQQVSASTKAKLASPQLPVPFANLEYPQGTRKQDRLGSCVLR